MKVIILAGGLGTRLEEYTKKIPKPMVKIGKYPILVHLMEIYISWGFNDFLIAAGYKSSVLKKYFNKFKLQGSRNFSHKIKSRYCKMKIIDTGLGTMTGGRLKKISKYIKKNESFMFTYGDGLGNVNLKKLISFHKKKNKIITVTAVHPPARFGEIIIDKNKLVSSFKEKPQVTSGRINGGFFVTDKRFFKFIKNEKTILEREPLEKTTENKQLSAYIHNGFWKCMDTKRDKDELETLDKKKKIKPWLDFKV